MIDARFHDLASEIRRDLAPVGHLETLLVDQVVRAAELLAITIEQGDDIEAGDPFVESIRLAVETLDGLRTRRWEGRGREVVRRPPSKEGDSPFRPFVAPDDADSEPGTVPGPPISSPIWEDRLVFDFGMSETSPVVKGTWVTVDRVVSMVVDGHTWNDIIRAHPELTEDDIHVCLAYALDEQDGGFEKGDRP